MNRQRPKISPELIAAMIDSTPDRVRRRLDRTPDAAASWDWQVKDTGWSVSAGEETVTLPHEHLVAVEQITCTCLLSPRCFHVLACLTRLDVAVIELAPTAEAAPADAVWADTEEDVSLATDTQRRAAQELAGNLSHLLRVGVAHSGVIVQSGLLRAVHQCRAEGLHRLAALGLRIIAGIREFRTQMPVSDPAQLADDLADALEASRHLLGEGPIASFWMGTARRKQTPVRPRKLHGLFAEPIVTRSGYSGAAVYFLGEDDRVYSASDVRPGDVQHARDAYLGGIEIGPIIQPAKQLARRSYLGSDLTASQDRRLGRGKGIKVVDQGASSWQVEAIQDRFRRVLPDQWKGVYAQTALPADARPAGWDFVFLQGTVLGASGPDLLFQQTADVLPIRLAIENENEALCFRENLRMLGHAPGLELMVIARMNLQEPRIASPLAVAAIEGHVRSGEEPRLDLPASLAGRVCLGFDEIQRPFLVNARPSALVLAGPALQLQKDDLLDSLRRRWIATMLSGIGSHRARNAKLLAGEIAALERVGLSTGAALLDALCRTPEDCEVTGIGTFLAAAIYLRTCSCELAKARAMQ
jgi:hypothetical protein